MIRRLIIAIAASLAVLVPLVVVLLFNRSQNHATGLGPTPTPTATVSLTPTPSTTPTAPEQPTPSASPSASPTASPAPIQSATPTPPPTCISVAGWSITRRLSQLIMVSGDFSNIAASVPNAQAGVPGLTGTVPAGLSAATYRYLRTTLHFTGVALTDSLGAGAISGAGYSQPAAALTALESGADMVIINASLLQPILVALGDAVNSGALQLSQVNASVTRILVTKGIAVCAG